MKKDFEKILKLLQSPKKIVITTHRSPDGDAIGSSLALYDILLKLNHHVSVITPNDSPTFLHWMKGYDKVLQYELNKDKATNKTLEADIVFLLDMNSIERVGEYKVVLKESNAIKIMLDHHQNPDYDSADIIISEPNRSSTCELLYDFVSQLGLTHLIDSESSECIYAGIMTDTGSFKFPSTTESTHKIVSDLINIGADNAKIHDFIYDTFTFDRLKLLGYCINEKLTVLSEYNTAYISLNERELNNFNFKKGDTEGIVNYALAIKNIIFAIFIVEKEGQVKLSFRSKGDFRVDLFAKDYFNGGGHINASGGVSKYNLEKTIKYLIEMINKDKKKLIKN